MLKIQRFVCNMLQENCYVVSDETQECVIVDCGAYYPEEKEAISLYIEENQLKPVHLLATHGHLDHNFGNGFIYEKYGLSVELHGDDLEFINQHDEQAEKFFPFAQYDSLPAAGRHHRVWEPSTESHRNTWSFARWSVLLLRRRKGVLLWRHPVPRLHRSYRFEWRIDVHAHSEPSHHFATPRRHGGSARPWSADNDWKGSGHQSVHRPLSRKLVTRINSSKWQQRQRESS